MNILDFVVLAIIGFTVFKGLRKGMVLTIFEIASFFVAAFCASTYHQQVSKFLVQTKVFEWVQQAVTKGVQNINYSTVQTAAPAEAANSIMDTLQLPNMVQKTLLDNSSEGIKKALGIDHLMQSISTSISSFFITILSMVLIFFVVKLILHIVAHILNGIMKLPLLNTANRVTGALFGVVNGIFVVYILFAIVALLAPMQAFSPVYNLINQSSFAKAFYHNNLLLKFIF